MKFVRRDTDVQLARPSVVMILLAEDEPQIGLSLQEMLVGAGYRVRYVANSEEALAGVLADNVTGLVTDIQLGSGPTGWDIAERARERKPGLPVVYISGNRAHEHAERGVPDSIMLRKPFVAGQFMRAAARLLKAEDA